MDLPYLKYNIEHSQLPQSSLYSMEEFQIVTKILLLAFHPFSGPFLPADSEPFICADNIEHLLNMLKLLLLPPVVLKDAIRLLSLSDIQGINENYITLVSATAALTNACKMKLLLNPIEAFRIFPSEGLIHFQVFYFILFSLDRSTFL